MSASAAAAPVPASEKPCHHADLCRCDVAKELTDAIEAAVDAVTLHGRASDAAERVARNTKSGKIRMADPARKK